MLLYMVMLLVMSYLGDFDEEEIRQTILDNILEPGDLHALFSSWCYTSSKEREREVHFHNFIIGFALPDNVTLSTHQKNTWGDLLEKVIHH